MQPTSNFATGIKFGIAAGIAYILMLVLRYMFFAANPMTFSAGAITGYVVLIVFMLVAARFRRKELGGYADVKQLFQTVFIVILIAEVCYSLFNYIYLRYIDPTFLDRFVQNSLEWLERMKMPEDKMEQMRESLEAQKKTELKTVFLGFFQFVIIDSIIGLIIAFIMKKQRPVSDFDNINP